MLSCGMGYHVVWEKFMSCLKEHAVSVSIDAAGPSEAWVPIYQII